MEGQQPTTNLPQTSQGSPATGNTNEDNSKSASSKFKDPSRPKRKKARRACFACQRAHLTCGDERPCERCIKRGLQDSCHNGMRKKAKYLHDTPDDALSGEIIHDESPVKAVPVLSKKDSSRNVSSTSRQQAEDIYGVGVTDDGFGVAEEDFGRSSRMSDTRQTQQAMPTFQRLNSSASGIAPDMSFDSHGMSATTTNDYQQPAQNLPQMTSAFDPTFFDANDSNFFNFDTANMDFGNHYGAMEFGILDHMSSGARANNDMFVRPSIGSHRYSTTFNQNGLVNGFLPLNGPLNMNGRTSVTDWQANPLNQGLTMNSWNTNFTPELGLRQESMSNEPNAFTIGAVPGYATTGSPASSLDFILRYDDTPTTTDISMSGMQPTPSGFLQLTDTPTFTNRPSNHQKTRSRPINDPPPQPPSAAATPSLSTRKLDLTHLPPNPSAKRARDPATIYATTTTPYPYTLAFHALTSVLHRRLPPPSRLLIAQALASIRPSFISCTRTLIHDDLVFMEKCFQRQLLEYEEFIAKVGTPTVVCRRTGEVAGVGKEFCLLTGWDRDVLLGLKPNGNANVGRGGGGSNSTGTTSRPNGTAGQTGGAATPRNLTTAGVTSADGTAAATKDAVKVARVQPVFLAELLDDGSIIRFYEDFAKLAFADSKGSAWSPCKLLRYRSKEEMLRRGLEREKRREKERRRSGDVDVDVDKEDKGKEVDVDVVECMWCWTVKRDVFDIPMMIVINFLPII